MNNALRVSLLIILCSCSSNDEYSTTSRLHLDKAYNVASSIAVDPHIKTRSLYQSKVVSVALELDMPKTAENYARQIRNWRAGLGLARVALYNAQAGDVEGVAKLVSEAIERGEDPLQDWRLNKVRSISSAALHLSGDDKNAKNVSEDLLPAERMEFDQAVASTVESKNIDEQIIACAKQINSMNFDEKISGLSSLLSLLEVVVSQEAYRNEINDLINRGINDLPFFHRINFRVRVIEIHLDANYRLPALKMADALLSEINELNLGAPDKIAAISKLANLYYKCDDVEKARMLLSNGAQLYDEAEKSIVNIDRCELLLMLAEVAHTSESAGIRDDLYLRALQAAFVNVNHRPRAEDVTQIYCSLAVNQVEPGELLSLTLDEKYSVLVIY